jgi:hypothetical protein
MTKTHDNSGARLVLDNSGQIAVKSPTMTTTTTTTTTTSYNSNINSNGNDHILWMDGIPKNQYTGPSSDNMIFPIRG